MRKSAAICICTSPVLQVRLCGQKAFACPVQIFSCARESLCFRIPLALGACPTHAHHRFASAPLVSHTGTPPTFLVGIKSSCLSCHSGEYLFRPIEHPLCLLAASPPPWRCTKHPPM
eukprot:GHVT01025353.1.p1 GENE.GHVT01025353.1~~GHVT01025353.1.p1  ORF type:complete len:117 (+),score=7.41 GHVT01025353.1:417-767(+)